ncbi:CHAP domain-containing protein [Flavobacterium sp. HNIBRBA15423]|uniref:CHAP domain-containing protein n=1 Tax=Flavobacterium sp. HNIBRBA15423 TaxID=3458683 RepID=UPI004044A5CB
MKKIITIIIIGLAVIYLIQRIVKKININTKHHIGEVIDEFNGVRVYYNGGIDHTSGRNVTKDGYNIGINYQCVEFVKRYYYEFYNHKMPDSYGNAKDFFDKNIPDGAINTKRNLVQHQNPSKQKPEINDILIFNKNIFNPYGHVAIISNVSETNIEIIQQNPGPFSKSRELLEINQKDGFWTIKNDRVLGTLHLKSTNTN